MDTSTAFGQRVATRLANDQVIWLATVDGYGTPQPVPVWFYWDGHTVLVYSQPDQPKLRNIARNHRVSLNFNSDFHGGDVVVLVGDAALDPAASPADQHQAYVEKYAGGIESISMTPASFAAAYSVAVRVTPTKVRGH
ncbi:MAG: TIGR03667 family PPOX class F420-dependent oxidoreductase [Thermomicrobiales bacterium]|nr:TIGR03667 family PPOX class F420-dependent oxidoreductase [Thermomicrobiales bacterium]